MTNSGFLHATCLHDNTFDTLDSVVSRLQATFLSSVRSPSNCTSPTRRAIVFFRGVPCKEGWGGCFQTESIQSGGNAESLAENVSRFSSFTEPRAIVLGICTNRLCFIVYIRQCVSYMFA